MKMKTFLLSFFPSSRENPDREKGDKLNSIQICTPLSVDISPKQGRMYKLESVQNIKIHHINSLA